MPRPIKEGLDYFPIDIDMDGDDKIELIEAKHGLVGFGLIIKLLMKIYRNGYYYEWGEKEQLLFAKRVNVDINLINDVVNDAAKWKFFNEDMLEKYNILTSRGIQKRYLKAAGRRQRLEIQENYLLLGELCVNEYENLVIVDINSIDTNIGTQRKVKESKEKKSTDLGKVIPPTVRDIDEYCKERKNGIDAEHFYNFYESKDWYVGKNKMKNWKSAVITWEKSRKEKEGKLAPERVIES